MLASMKRFSLVFTTFLTLGCGGGSGSGSVPLDELGTELTAVSCAQIFECCTAAEIVEDFGFFDEADCVAKLGVLIGQEVQAETEAAVAAGKMTYNADNAAECLALTESASCATYNDDSPSVCDQITTGLVAADAACDDDAECVSGYCEGDADQTPGQCKTMPGLGELCPDFTCADGNYCEFASESSCVAQKADGQSCGFDEECINSCENDICGVPTSCDGL